MPKSPGRQADSQGSWTYTVTFLDTIDRPAVAAVLGNLDRAKPAAFRLAWRHRLTIADRIPDPVAWISASHQGRTLGPASLRRW